MAARGRIFVPMCRETFTGPILHLSRSARPQADSGGGGEGGGGEVSAADEETAEEEQEEVSAERVSLLESADDTAERVRATAASAVEHAKEASQAVRHKRGRHSLRNAEQSMAPHSVVSILQQR